MHVHTVCTYYIVWLIQSYVRIIILCAEESVVTVLSYKAYEAL